MLLINMYLYHALALILLLRIVTCQTGAPLCPDASELAPFCSCKRDTLSRLILDCSQAHNENQLEGIFTGANFPNLDFYEFRILNNKKLQYLTRNVFGNVSFESVYFSLDSISYIHESVFANSYSTLSKWYFYFCNLACNGCQPFPFYSLSMYENLESLDIIQSVELQVTPKISSNSLTLYDLQGSQMQFLPPDSLSELPALTTLYIGNNKIKTLSPALFDNNPLLRYIYIHTNDIEKLDFGTFRNLENLSILVLHTNNISTIEAASFFNLPKLYQLELYNNGIQNFPYESLGNLPSLTRLYINNNNLHYLEKYLLLGSPLLKIFYANNNKILTIDEGIFANVPLGGEIRLNNNLLSTLDESWLRRALENGNYVDVSDNPLECGCDLAWLFNFPMLMTNLTAVCSNGTEVQNLDSSFFIINC